MKTSIQLNKIDIILIYTLLVTATIFTVVGVVISSFYFDHKLYNYAKILEIQEAYENAQGVCQNQTLTAFKVDMTTHKWIAECESRVTKGQER